MHSALITLLCSTVVLGICIGVFRIEDNRGGTRVVLSRLRTFNDTLFTRLFNRVRLVYIRIGKGVIQLFFHYILHAVFRLVQLFLLYAQSKIEIWSRYNRQIAKKIATQKTHTHLDDIAAHQKETALSEAEKQKLRSHDV